LKDIRKTASDVLGKCSSRGWSLAVAESCTGGLLGGSLTAIPGSSEVFVGGVITYSNSLKSRLLGVPAQTLELKGAVSEETAFAMARGVRTITGADCGISVTGVAGPSGGTDEKPVGTVWFAAVGPAGEIARGYRFAGGRDAVREQSVQAALELVLEVMDLKEK